MTHAEAAMPATVAKPRAARPRGRAPAISLLTATCIVVANMIGTGVFTSLGFQVMGLPSAFAVLLLWIVGGVVALCGALSYAELAAALPRSGGEYHFLSRIYHPALGFLAGWTSATVGFAAPIALTAMVFGTYLDSALPPMPAFLHFAPESRAFVFSLAVVWINALVHFTGVRRGSAFQDGFTVLKVGLIVAFLAAGFGLANAQPISWVPRAADWRMAGSGAFAVSLVYVMYAYSGWNASTYIVGEIRDPRRNVPRSVLLGTLLVIVLYVGLNAAFLRTTPMAEMAAAAAQHKPNVAALAGAHIFGTAGGRVMNALICIGLVSTISSMTWIGPRVTVAMGEDFRALRFLATQTRNGIPRVALGLQLLIVNVLLFTATFEQVTNYITPALTFFSFLTVLGVFVLRVKEPALPRPYRTWGYPLTPGIFLAVSAWMMFYIVSDKPRESLAGLLTMLAGLAVYFASARGRACEESSVRFFQKR